MSLLSNTACENRRQQRVRRKKSFIVSSPLITTDNIHTQSAAEKWMNDNIRTTEKECLSVPNEKREMRRINMNIKKYLESQNEEKKVSKSISIYFKSILCQMPPAAENRASTRRTWCAKRSRRLISSHSIFLSLIHAAAAVSPTFTFSFSSG